MNYWNAQILSPDTILGEELLNTSCIFLGENLRRGLGKAIKLRNTRIRECIMRLKAMRPRF